MNQRKDPIEQAIQAAAVPVFGSAAVEVLAIDERPSPWTQGGTGWWWLSVGGELIGRRRSKLELLEMLKRRAR